MRITETKRDDILKQKAEYEKTFKERKDRYDKQYQDYNNAEYNITSAVEEEIKNQLNKYRALTFDVRAKRNYDSHKGVEIRIYCNENNKFDDNVALSWNYKVSINDEGEVEKESSSWSGLKAVTEEQIESLEQTLEALKYLNKVDWKTVLNKELPKYDDYVTERNPSFDNDKPNFDKMLMEADIEECIGKNVLIKAGGSKNYRTEVYFGILSETPTRYKVFDIPVRYVENPEKFTRFSNIDDLVEDCKKYAYAISKDKFYQLVYEPIETLEV